MNHRDSADHTSTGEDVRMLHRSFTLVCVLVAAACSPNSPTSPISRSEALELTRARSLWNARPFRDYTYETLGRCDCNPVVSQWTRVTIRDGVVVAAQHAEADTVLPANVLLFWQPIDALFAQLERAVTAGDFKTTYADILMTFDPLLGFPTRVEYVAWPWVADAGGVFEYRRVSALP